MPFRIKLTLIFSFFVCVIAGVAGISIFGSDDLTEKVKHLASVQMPAMENMAMADMNHDGLRAIAYRALYFSGVAGAEAEKKEIIEDLNETSESLKQRINSISELPIKASTKSAIEKTGGPIEDYIKVVNEVTTLAVEDKKSQANNKVPDMEIRFSHLEKALADLSKTINEDTTQIKDAGTDSQQKILLFSLLSIFIGIAFAIYVIKSISGPLVKSYDEVSHGNAAVVNISTALTNASLQLASSSHQQATSVEQVSSSLEEISGMVSAALTNSRDSVTLSNRVSSLVAAGTESMTELQMAVNELAVANSRVEKLGKLIEEIGEKTELIDEIVFQTRLLSFNASVEAERAGEHGRGFAVVAQEVGNLAQMSGKSASEIGQIVKNSIKEAQEVVQLNRKKVEQSVELCKKTSAQLVSIEKSSKDIQTGSEQILRASEEQNLAIQQINESIQLINRVTQTNASSAESCSENSQLLTEQSHVLSNVVGDLEFLVYGRRTQNPGRSDDSHHPTKPIHHGNDKSSKNVVAFAKFKKRNVEPSALPTKKVMQGSRAVNQQDDPWDKI